MQTIIIADTVAVDGSNISSIPNQEHGPATQTEKEDEINSETELPHTSLAPTQLSKGFLNIFEPSLVRVRNQLKELIGKQNKIYIDLSAEKFKLDNNDVVKLQQMMYNVKVYREKLIKIQKQMHNLYQRMKIIKKRTANINSCKQKELQRKLHKQQQEELLIGKAE
ncbi:biogenesis of lysosome-related organelles complex 1 subunit 6 isoform X2 [Teleopsis dalmanni]|uniref:biogenesis of lysosome-related organelles complex 1 subunit 6 isoform X2 n=1 Tax=Teleopsis dalmanni TaxID=139649 RepID=UPI0018CF033D|nr:biogenesis of lysosome-related organelles complex 1 subunit 6 isoform X2 [Teleopsis dalmanni]